MTSSLSPSQSFSRLEREREGEGKGRAAGTKGGKILRDYEG